MNNAYWFERVHRDVELWGEWVITKGEEMGYPPDSVLAYVVDYQVPKEPNFGPMMPDFEVPEHITKMSRIIAALGRKHRQLYDLIELKYIHLKTRNFIEEKLKLRKSKYYESWLNAFYFIDGQIEARLSIVA